jgi:hypothetical protein
MEPKPKRNDYEEDSNYINVMGFNRDSHSNQTHFLTLRKNKRINSHLNNRQLEIEKNATEKYKIDQNSYDQTNPIIQNFFNAQDKPTFLSQLLLNLFNSNNDPNIIKFILFQTSNYYESQKNNNDNANSLEKFFTEPILNNLVQTMYMNQNEFTIIYIICSLLLELTFRSSSITKILTLNTKNIQQIFDCLRVNNEDVTSIILSLLYNCYMENEDTVNTNCNIGVYVFEALNNYARENQKSLNKSVVCINDNIKILVSFLCILINKNTSEVYKSFDNEKRNNIIYFLLVLCRDVYDEALKIDSHNALERMLSLDEPEDINVDRIGLVNIPEIFLPHIKLESNSSEIVEISMEILNKFSYLCDVEVLISDELIEQLDKILFSFIDMENNKTSPKPFYRNYNKKSVNKILNNLSFVLTNAITLFKLEKYINKETNIIDNLTMCLSINDLDNETLVNIYDFFKEFIHNKDNCVKVILANFLDIGILDVLKKNLSNKNYDVIQAALEVCLLMMKECNQLTNGNSNNVIKIYLEKKGFNEILNVVSGVDFGNTNCSEIAKNVQDNFFN